VLSRFRIKGAGNEKAREALWVDLSTHAEFMSNYLRHRAIKDGKRIVAKRKLAEFYAFAKKPPFDLTDRGSKSIDSNNGKSLSEGGLKERQRLRSKLF
jgi:hypothetical protein